MIFFLNCIIDLVVEIFRLRIGGFSDCMHIDRSMILVDRSSLIQNACRPVDGSCRPVVDKCRPVEVDTEALSTGQ